MPRYIVGLLAYLFLGCCIEGKTLPKKSRPQNDLQNDATCLGNPETFGQICCKNCTECCSEKDSCNFGQGNKGVGNIGSFNYGDFNMANGSRGDCNLVDEAWGIGGPEYRGCPKEIQDHIVKYCAINPTFKKCGFPPYYFGEDLADTLREVVRACDEKIPTRPQSKKSKRKAKTKRAMERIRVVKAKTLEERKEASQENSQ